VEVKIWKNQFKVKACTKNLILLHKNDYKEVINMQKLFLICAVFGLLCAVNSEASPTLSGNISTVSTGGVYEYYDYIIDRSCTIDLGPASPGAVINGAVSNLAFGTAGDSASGSWLEIGFIAQNRADASIDVYSWPSFMFNQSAFLVAYENSDGDLLVMPADTDMGYGSVAPGGPGGGSLSDYFDLGNADSFSFALSVIPDGTGAGGDINLSIIGETGTKTWKYGYDNWEWVWWKTGSTPDPGESEFYGDFQNAYCIAQGYANNYGGSVYADINATCSVIPAPGAILLGSIGAGCVGWLRRKKML